tara:strand:- start:462 stop:1655 length:1194 start_codon:yes stop_codon:yes gene_type:complete
MNKRSIDFGGTISKWGNLLIKMISNIKYGNITLITPEGKYVKFSGEKEGEEVSVKINNWRVCEDIFLKGDIGLGESYISGYWDCKDISKLIKLGIANYDELERVIKGSLLKIVFYRTKHFLKRNSKKGSRENIYAHYDIGNDFFKLWLDPSMTYSSAIFENINDDLFRAQENKYEKILKNLNIKSGDHILEVGCGWGGFMEYAAKKGIKVTGVTISEEQYNFAKQRLKNFGNLSEIRLQDYREVSGSFDHIVSIEMFEAIGESYWKKFFKTLHSVLKPGGKMVIQSITINNRDFSSYRKCSDFIQQYIFPGGMLPSPEIFIATAVKQGFDYLNNVEFGKDYGLTLRKWEENFSLVLNKIKDLGFDEKFIRTWRFYLKYCQGGFESRKISVSQFNFVK